MHPSRRCNVHEFAGHKENLELEKKKKKKKKAGLLSLTSRASTIVFGATTPRDEFFRRFDSFNDRCGTARMRTRRPRDAKLSGIHQGTNFMEEREREERFPCVCVAIRLFGNNVVRRDGNSVGVVLTRRSIGNS